MSACLSLHSSWLLKSVGRQVSSWHVTTGPPSLESQPSRHRSKDSKATCGQVVTSTFYLFCFVLPGGDIVMSNPNIMTHMLEIVSLSKSLDGVTESRLRLSSRSSGVWSGRSSPSLSTAKSATIRRGQLHEARGLEWLTKFTLFLVQVGFVVLWWCFGVHFGKRATEIPYVS